MTAPQVLSFAIIAAMLGLFIWGSLRYDLVAALALIAAVLCQVVPAEHAFDGFSNPVVVIIGSVLVLSRAIAASGAVEAATRRLLRPLPRLWQQVGVLTACVTALSAFMKNVGALGIFMPVAIRTAQRSKRAPSLYLMPLAFGSLIGGTITQIGTSPNLLISAVRQEVEGRPFGLFDYTPVGLPLSVLAVVFLAFGHRLLPSRRRGPGAAEAEAPVTIENYVSEARLPAGSPFVNKPVAELEALADHELAVVGIVRDGGRRYIPAGHWWMFADDVLVLRADPVVLQDVVQRAGLQLVGTDEYQTGERTGEDTVTTEAVVTPDSLLVGTSAKIVRLRQRYELNLLSLRRASRQVTTRLNEAVLQPGDVLVLQGWESEMAENLAGLGVLPLADRELRLGRRKPRLLSLLILGIALALIAARLATVEVAFFAAAVLVVLLRLVSPKEVYGAIDWPVIIMLACLIPVGEGLQRTGGSQLIAAGLTGLASHVSPMMGVGIVLLASMLLTPLMHHAAAVVVLGPVAASVARGLGLAVDPFLMAVALGASCDFLTPIGHQNNMLVMGPGGYRFGDYWRLGLPLSCLVTLVGTPLICWVWPLR